MKRIHLIALVAACMLCMTASAQRGSVFLSAGGGAAWYIGDLKDNALPSLDYLSPAGSFRVKYKYSNIFSVSAGYMRTRLWGADSLTRNDTRDFFFRSDIDDFSIIGRLNLGGFRSTFYSQHRVISYPGLLAGVSYFRFNPQVYYQGAWIDARTLGTEGQFINNPGDVAYNNWSPSLKVGSAITFYLTHKIDLDLYWYYSLTFTDKIDDVGGYYPNYEALLETPNGEIAQEFTYRHRTGELPAGLEGAKRGNPDSNDGFHYIGFDLAYKVNDKRNRRKGPRRGSRPRF